uniref:Uncharacterized protein n=1 Tax=Tanacetum cinerariifolium TaxID=118510 RepID=A0A699J9A6_TANCI|nr:hypothetical protein [Tanacetum cinerariifolium]
MAEIRNSIQSLYVDGDWGCSRVHMNDNDDNLDKMNGRKGGNNDGKNDAIKRLKNGLECSSKTLYDAYLLANMQEATNKILRDSCKIVDTHSVDLDVNHCLENKGNKMVTNKEKHVVLQDTGKKEDCKSEISVVNKAGKREQRKEIGNGVIDISIGLIGIKVMDCDDKDVGYGVEDICEENVKGADMELEDNNCLGIIDKVFNKTGKGNALESSKVEVNWVVIVDELMKVEDKNKSDVSVESLFIMMKKVRILKIYENSLRGKRIRKEHGGGMNVSFSVNENSDCVDWDAESVEECLIGIQMDACSKMESGKVLNKIEPLSCVLQHLKESMRKIESDGLHTKIGATGCMERILDTIKENYMASDQPLAGKFLKDRGKNNESKVLEMDHNGSVQKEVLFEDVRKNKWVNCKKIVFKGSGNSYGAQHVVVKRREGVHVDICKWPKRKKSMWDILPS